MPQVRTALGLMTGTALDGFIDAAILRTDGENVEELGAWALVGYSAELRAQMAAAVADARAWDFNGPEPESFAPAERAFTEAHAVAVRELARQAGLDLAGIDVVGFHGLTVLHRPGRATRQLGDGALLAKLLGVDVAFDFRTADVAAGGQGAPLAPIYHAALLDRAGLDADTAVLNLGGVANITWRDRDNIAAFDTGPANGPLNEWCEQHGRGAMDEGGRIAAAGKVDESRLAKWLANAFFAQPYPKSLDRYDFSAKLAEGLSLEDGAATLTALTAAGVGRGLDLLPHRPKRIVVCGGGRKNPQIMRELSARAGVEPIDSDALGWRGDAIEAEAFAYLAVRTLEGLPISFPQTTGVVAAMPGGRIARA